MNEQQRQEITELILRAMDMESHARVLRATGRTDIYRVLTAEENAHHAKRELWEALYRITLDER